MIKEQLQEEKVTLTCTRGKKEASGQIHELHRPRILPLNQNEIHYPLPVTGTPQDANLLNEFNTQKGWRMKRSHVLH